MKEAGWLGELTDIISKASDVVWGMPLIFSILFTGALLTLLLKFSHIFSLGKAFKFMFSGDSGSGEVSQFGSLCTALSATIGTGNIVGVATAISTGGPGALFWMEVAAFFGMATKYAEGFLAIKYRNILPSGRVLGGPFYYIERGLQGRFGIGNWKWLAILFAVFGVLAGIMGIGTVTQIQGITSAVEGFFCPGFDPESSKNAIEVFGVKYPMCTVISGFIITFCVALVVIGGIKRIAAVATVLVPFMAITYIVSIVTLLLFNCSKIMPAIVTIVKAAFDPAAVTGGVVGTVFIAVQKGVARGIFSNEAGLGSAPIAAAAAKTNEPVEQGLVCMTGTFIDTIVICTMTGLAIVVTGAWEPSLGLKGVNVTMETFTRGFSFLGTSSSAIASFFLMMSLTFFAFTTILGWNYYSEKCLEYLVGSNRLWAVKIYRFLYVAVVFTGPYLTISAVWGLADVFNGLMAFPNLIALILLSPVIARETKKYFCAS
jgi:AGCS family alanine or glycine:cation symporter